MRDDLQDPYYRPRNSNAFTTMALLAIGISIGMVLIVTLKACDKEPQPVAAQVNCSVECHNKKAAFTEYFRSAGSKQPEVMANAVLNTESPRLLAAVAKVESGGNVHLRNTGYKKRHHGAYQVNTRFWGRVPEDAIGQTLQAEAIIKELTTAYGLEKGLAIYGGDSTSKYQRRILAELQEVPR